ncbi:MAG: alpha/beta hydrolase, partial [Acidimicrobiales bacterium]
MPTPAVPYDPEIKQLMDAGQLRTPAPPELGDTERVARSRKGLDDMVRPMADVVAGRPVEHEERVIEGPSGDLEITIIRPAGGVSGAPGLYNMHPGGLISGSRYTSAASLVDWTHRFGFVCMTIEYGRAPENPNLGPAEDSYAGLLWMAEHAQELGVDPDRMIVGGASAGGLLSASMALMARDMNGPALLGQLLVTPMLDDRNVTVSTHQYDG